MARARYREYPPCPVLRPYVKALFTFAQDFSDDNAPGNPNREIVTAPGGSSWSAMFADSGVSVVFCFRRTLSDRRSVESSPAIRARHRPYDCVWQLFSGYRAAAGWRVFASRLRFIFPWRSGTRDRGSSREAGFVVDASRAHRKRDCRLRKDSRRIAVLQEALVRCLKPRCARAIAQAVRMIHESGEQLTVQSVAESIGISRQLLGREFREHIGLSPKLYLRLHRFRKALVSLSFPQLA